jgi:hypothetical protein
MAVALTLVLAAVALGLAYAVRARRVEAATVLIVALPIVLFVPPNTPRWISQLRRDHNRNSHTNRAVIPVAILSAQNQALEDQAKLSIGQRQTYAIIPRGRWARRRADTSTLRYLESWLQFQLAPRLQVDPDRADWLIVLDGANEPPPEGATTVYTLDPDLLVRRSGLG